MERLAREMASSVGFTSFRASQVLRAFHGFTTYENCSIQSFLIWDHWSLVRRHKNGAVRLKSSQFQRKPFATKFEPFILWWFDYPVFGPACGKRSAGKGLPVLQERRDVDVLLANYLSQTMPNYSAYISSLFFSYIPNFVCFHMFLVFCSCYKTTRIYTIFAVALSLGNG
jgi:hypothetical protein